MAIKFQYNKTSLTELNKQLKTRTRALPTLKSKESALRLEVKKAKNVRKVLSRNWRPSSNRMSTWPGFGMNLSQD